MMLVAHDAHEPDGRLRIPARARFVVDLGTRAEQRASGLRPDRRAALQRGLVVRIPADHEARCALFVKLMQAAWDLRAAAAGCPNTPTALYLLDRAALHLAAYAWLRDRMFPPDDLWLAMQGGES
jgi:hypothetical protein